MVIVGLSVPAFAEGSFQQYMNNWDNGSKSTTWHDYNKDSVSTHVTTDYGCTREFTGRIRRQNFGPDTTVGSEWINCTSYTDAVSAGDVAADDYHFDVSGMTGSCGKFECPTPTTSGWIHIYW